MVIKCENYLRYFKKYTDSYFTEVPLDDKFKIELKIVHTMNVLKLMRRLAKDQDLSGEDYEIAKVIGLFHDFGRFNQLKLYGHFNDRTSLNHAEESVREMQRLNILDQASDVYVPEYKKELIYKAILNHNRDEIIGENDEKLILMSKLIRDADKVDILRVNYETPIEEIYNTNREILITEKITDTVYEAFFQNTAIEHKLKTTHIDHLIGHLSLISELEYPISVEILKEMGYLEKLLEF